MPPKVAAANNPNSEPEPDPAPPKMKCWICKKPYDKSELRNHISVDHPMIRPFSFVQEVNSKDPSSPGGSASGEVTGSGVTQGQEGQQAKSQVQGPTRLSSDESTTVTSTAPHVEENSPSSDEIEAQETTEDQGEGDIAINNNSQDTDEHMDNEHLEHADESMEDAQLDTANKQPSGKAAAREVIDVDSSSSSASASPVRETGSMKHTRGQVQARGMSEHQVHYGAENLVRQFQGRGTAPFQGPPYGTEVQDVAHAQAQFYGRTRSQGPRGGANRWKPTNERTADDGDHEDEGKKRKKQDGDDNLESKGSRKVIKQSRDFGSRDSSPDGIQRTFQSLKQGDYGINWSGSDVPDAPDTRERRGYRDDSGNTNARTNSRPMMQNQGRNLDSGYGMSRGSNGTYAAANGPEYLVHPGYNPPGGPDLRFHPGYQPPGGNANRASTSLRAGYRPGNPPVNRGSENQNRAGIPDLESQSRRDQRMDIGHLVQDSGDDDTGYGAGRTQQTQQQTRTTPRLRDGSGAANTGEAEVAQILAQQFQNNRPRSRNPPPSKLQIDPNAPRFLGPPTPIKSGSSPGSGSELHSGSSPVLKLKKLSDGTDVYVDQSPIRTRTTTAVTATDSRPTTNSVSQAIIPRDAKGRPLTKDGAVRAVRGSLAAKMPGPDVEPELKTPDSAAPNTDAWFRAVFLAPDNMKANPPVEIWSHQSKPWETFQNELRRASKDVAGRFIKGQKNGFGLEHGNWFFTFIGRGTFKNDGSRVWGELPTHSIPYRDMASSVIGDPGRNGVIIMHAMQLADARKSGRIKVVDGWAEFPDMATRMW